MKAFIVIKKSVIGRKCFKELVTGHLTTRKHTAPNLTSFKRKIIDAKCEVSAKRVLKATEVQL